MNTLSILIYLADFFGTLKQITLIVGGLGVVIWVIWFTATTDYKPNRPPFWFGAIAFISLFVGALIPSNYTMKLIAASEIGELLITNEGNKEILLEIKAVVMHQLKEVQQ